MSKFEEFKQSLGLESPTEEVWKCDPLVVVNDEDEIIWSGPAVVRYVPGKEKYEDGSGVAIDPENDALITQFTLEKILHRDPLGMPLPFGTFMPWGENGVTVYADDLTGRDIVLHTGTHADSYLAQRAAGEPPAEPPPSEI